ncbi:transcription regulator HTH, apses-type DNA-binding domain-containing protein [Cunninghamella echinulata]|nr:transcription regulator HTH, apses-type DNA-binding domain-containing protein [Cunninghamella echinulata]
MLSSNHPHHHQHHPSASSTIVTTSPYILSSHPPPSHHHNHLQSDILARLPSYSYSLPPHHPHRSYYPRPKLTTTLWEDERTLCFQVDANGICVARREDNDMINGTKLLNVAGMSRGKRDGILKNEKGRVVVKVGAMHLKGVWIPFDRAETLSEQFKIQDLLYPLFVDNPQNFIYQTPITGPISRIGPFRPYNNNSNNSSSWDHRMESTHLSEVHNDASSSAPMGKYLFISIFIYIYIFYL